MHLYTLRQCIFLVETICVHGFLPRKQLSDIYCISMFQSVSLTQHKTHLLRTCLLGKTSLSNCLDPVLRTLVMEGSCIGVEEEKEKPNMTYLVALHLKCAFS